VPKEVGVVILSKDGKGFLADLREWIFFPFYP